MKQLFLLRTKKAYVRLFSLFLSLLLLGFSLGGVLFAAAAGEFPCGDINGSGQVDIFDIITLRNHLFGTTLLSEDALLRADVNEDAEINIYDILFIRDIIFKGPDPTPNPQPASIFEQLAMDETEITVRVGETKNITVRKTCFCALESMGHVITYTVADDLIATAERQTDDRFILYGFSVTGKAAGTTTVSVYGRYDDTFETTQGCYETVTITTIKHNLTVHVIA